MAKQKKPVHRVEMTEGKRNIIRQLLEEYDIETAEDIQDALKDLLGGTIKEMMEAEMDDHLGYEKSQRSDNDDYRNGYKRKQVNSRYGSMEIEVPQDRKSTFEPQVVKKRQKDISDIDQKIISMYAKGMTTRQISETIEDIYGFETSESFISDVTDKILPQIEDWQNRPLDEVYPILYIDAIHYSVRDNGVIRKLAAYVILGINAEGKKEVLTITIGDNESAKYWLSVLNELKNRGVKDILIICADGLTGIKEAISAAFPKTEYQRCIVHQCSWARTAPATMQNASTAKISPASGAWISWPAPLGGSSRMRSGSWAIESCHHKRLLRWEKPFPFTTNSFVCIPGFPKYFGFCQTYSCILLLHVL